MEGCTSLSEGAGDLVIAVEVPVVHCSYLRVQIRLIDFACKISNLALDWVMVISMRVEPGHSQKVERGSLAAA